MGQTLALALVLLLWGAKVYIRAKYGIKYKVAREERWAWKRGSPDWITKLLPWLQVLSWAALVGLVIWWAYDPHQIAEGR